MEEGNEAAAQSAAQAQDASETETPLEVEEEGSETAAPSADERATQSAPVSVEKPETPAPKRGRPKGSKDAQPRTRTRPEPHTPSKKYTASDATTQSAAAPLLMHLEEVMASARQQEMLRKQDMYRSWLPY